MNATIRNILAFIAGVIALLAAKYVVTKIGYALIPPPGGINLSKVEEFSAAMRLYEAKHWVTPFLEHSAGSIAGGFVAALVAGSHKIKLAIGTGVLHLLGGVAAVALLPIPIWFSPLDLIFAYVPMAWIGGKLGSRS